jgi:general secretion pathway protein A
MGWPDCWPEYVFLPWQPFREWNETTTMMDLLAYWNLQNRPFEATWDTRFYYLSASHEEALNRLMFVADERSMEMGLLTGEIGCGKTLTRAVFVERLDPSQFCVLVQENSSFNFTELLGSILRSLDPEGRSKSKAQSWERFQMALARLERERKHLVLIFDEAQEMTPGTLNELKLMSNLNGDGCNLLTILLLGQPELNRRVAALPAINQRISVRYHLGPLSRDETDHYLRHRLKAAGHIHGGIFSDDAVDHIHEASQGVPRALNRLAKLSLEYAWLRELSDVSRLAVETVTRDMNPRKLCAA